MAVLDRYRRCRSNQVHRLLRSTCAASFSAETSVRKAGVFNRSDVFAPDIGADRISCHYRDVIVRAPKYKVKAVVWEQLE